MFLKIGLIICWLLDIMECQESVSRMFVEAFNENNRNRPVLRILGKDENLQTFCEDAINTAKYFDYFDNLVTKAPSSWRKIHSDSVFRYEFARVKVTIHKRTHIIRNGLLYCKGGKNEYLVASPAFQGFPRAFIFYLPVTWKTSEDNNPSEVSIWGLLDSSSTYRLFGKHHKDRSKVVKKLSQSNLERALMIAEWAIKIKIARRHFNGDVIQDEQTKEDNIQNRFFSYSELHAALWEDLKKYGIKEIPVPLRPLLYELYHSYWLDKLDGYLYDENNIEHVRVEQISRSIRDDTKSLKLLEIPNSIKLLYLQFKMIKSWLFELESTKADWFEYKKNKNYKSYAEFLKKLTGDFEGNVEEDLLRKHFRHKLRYLFEVYWTFKLDVELKSKKADLKAVKNAFIVDRENSYITTIPDSIKVLYEQLEKKII